MLGPPSRILENWKHGKLVLVVSHEILEEYRRVGQELSHQFPGVDVSVQLDIVAARAEVCTPVILPSSVCRDPDDDKFIACALGGRANLIVTGDKDLLVVDGYGGLQMVRPGELLPLLNLLIE